MATKKKAAKKRKLKSHLDIGSDPPILVGGGGSTYLWVRLDQDQKPVNPQMDNPGIGINPGAPTPHTRANYACTHSKGDPPSIYFFDGVTLQPLIIQNAKKWYLRID